MGTISVVELGRMEYRECWEIQKRAFRLRGSGAVGDLLLLTEHNHVYTLGKGADENHLLAGSAELASMGADVVLTDRGGDITYHGPGQIVGYPILDLRGYVPDLHRYLRDLEEVVIRVLGRLGIAARRIAGYTGVWVANDKICAIGVHASRWITMHGFALNVGTDLSMFGRIIPCGIFEKGVTSIEQVTGSPQRIEAITPLIEQEFGTVFGAVMEPRGREAFLRFLDEPSGEFQPVKFVKAL
jgi:lipoyl(octanoyl) transferase